MILQYILRAIYIFPIFNIKGVTLMSKAAPNLALQHLTKIYDTKNPSKKALTKVSFTLSPGLYGLLGPNGAGKSTMMNIITGNLDATSGKVLWNGKNVLRMGREFRRILGYMPQQQNLYDSFTGRRFLLYIAAPVSYTHLDVYKRQSSKRLRLPPRFFLCYLHS